MAKITSDINIAKEVLDQGEVIGLPTETVYGLAGNALKEATVLKIFEIKNRPKFDPLILHFSDYSKALGFIETPSERIQLLIKKFSPGPVTFLVNKKRNVSDLITAGLPRVAVRFPSHSTAQALLQTIDYPVAAPSANPFGYVSPTNAQHVDDQLGEKVNVILDGGSCTIGLESTIIGEESGEIIIYRKGGLTIESIERTVGTVVVKERSSSQPAAPGMLHNHYAPSTKTKILTKDSLTSLINEPRNAFILFAKGNIVGSNVHYLSETGNLDEAASNLFMTLRKLDKADYNTIYVELVPDVGLGRAINDRLKRATNS